MMWVCPLYRPEELFDREEKILTFVFSYATIIDV